jgi:hypothetical protein
MKFSAVNILASTTLAMSVVAGPADAIISTLQQCDALPQCGEPCAISCNIHQALPHPQDCLDLVTGFDLAAGSVYIFKQQIGRSILIFSALGTFTLNNTRHIIFGRTCSAIITTSQAITYCDNDWVGIWFGPVDNLV